MKTHQPMIAVHLDLKGMQFKPAYLPVFLRDLADQKVNTLFVEYEDVFPFEGLEIAADPAVAWTPGQVRKLNTLASELGIQIIPLQQCLGHLEYLLCWKKYRKLALNQAYPSTIDTSKPKARALIHNMLGQILAAHPDSPYIHMGMDEAHALVLHHGKENVVGVFLDFLDELLDQVLAAGKKAIIWSDMLENNLLRVGDKLASFKDRVILASWDYGADGRPTTAARLAGNHVSKAWVNDPANRDAPAVSPGTSFLEDQPRAVRKLLEPYQQGRLFAPLFLADMWTSLGFQVIGCSAIRSSADLSTLPVYHQKQANITAWSESVLRNKQLGHMATSWARGTSFIPPNYCIDAAWPLVGDLARSMAANPKPFFAGIPAKTAERIVLSLGRCRQDWSIELKLADEMDSLLPRLKAHKYEWQGMALLARVLNGQRRAAYAVSEVTYFAPNHRPVDSEWRRRLADQKEVLALLASLKVKVRAHFGKRWHGQAFEEWIGQMFDASEQSVKAAGPVCRTKLKLAQKRYNGR